MWAANVWDPALIIAQMVVLQCAYYLVGGTTLMCCHHLFGTDLSLRHLLLPAAFSVTDRSGWPAVTVAVANALALAWLSVPVVGRAKLCLDFIGTVYGYHVVACWVYAWAFPTGWTWWIGHILLLTCSVVVGEFLCMRKEMEAIPMDAPGSSPAAPASPRLLPPSTAAASDSRNGAAPPPRTSSPPYGSARSGNGAASSAAITDPDRVSLITIEPDLQTLLADDNNTLLQGITLNSLTSGSNGNGNGHSNGSNGVESSPSFAALDRMVTAMTIAKDRTH